MANVLSATLKGQNHEYGTFRYFSDYLISQSHYATATGLASVLDGEVSHDQISRFLRAEDDGSKELWDYVKPAIRRHEQSDGVLLLDDTISEKNYTDENAKAKTKESHHQKSDVSLANSAGS